MTRPQKNTKLGRRSLLATSNPKKRAMNKQKKEQTVGQAAVKASTDTTNYDALEVGYALSEDVFQQLWQCVDNHRHIIDEPEFCVVMVLADDPLIKGVMRRKFYAWPYLPSPRPRQSVFLYNRNKEDLTRLWILPAASAMATLSTMIFVDRKWQTMKLWSDAFFKGTFWEMIRRQHQISMLSEHEYLEANREKLIEAGCKYFKPSFSDPLDFAKIAAEKIVNSKASLTDKNGFQGIRET